MSVRLGPLAFALAVVSVLLIAAGTGGYSTMTADRSISVAVVPDAEAMFGIDRDLVVEANATQAAVTVTNRFSSDVTVEIEHGASDDGPSVEVEPASFTLAPGEDRTVSVAAECATPTNTTAEGVTNTTTNTTANTNTTLESTPQRVRVGDVEMDIHVSGDDVNLEMTRTVESVATYC